jgi:glycosyltransferase involved in cell wall biosynthesis
MKSVLIVQEHMPAFRIPFYHQLRERLQREEVRVDVVYAPNQKNTFLRGNLEWAIPVPMRRLGPVAWQPVLGLSRRYDLVIVQQEIKYLVNPVLQMLGMFGRPRIAFWGHGRNFQKSDESGIVDSMKRMLSTKVHWWFAYNDLSADIVAGMGFPRSKITSVGNAVDATGLITRRSSLREDDLAALHARLGTNGSENIVVYTGGIYANKRIPFLIDAAVKIRSRISDFHLIVIGDGPDRPLVKAAAAAHPWIHDIGPLGDEQKVPYWAISQLLLMPGLVGLVVVDSFALGTPIVTTDFPYHSPEVSYLKSGYNGLIVECGESSDMYASRVVDVLCDRDWLARMRRNARESAADHTIERMAVNFSDGVLSALASV